MQSSATRPKPVNRRRQISPMPRVPRLYLTWANQVFLAFFAFNGINNLRAFNIAFSSIPTAPTISKLKSYLESFGGKG
jgi:hypothetical protein